MTLPTEPCPTCGAPVVEARRNRKKGGQFAMGTPTTSVYWTRRCSA